MNRKVSLLFFTSIVFLLVGLISSDRVYAETQGLGGWLRGTWWSGNTLVEDMTFSWTNGVYAQVRAGDRVYYERHIWHCDTVGLQWCDSTNGGTLLFTGANFDSWLLPNYNSTKDTSIGNGLIYNGCGTFQEDFTAKTSGGVNISGPVIAGWVINGSTGASCTTTPPPTPGCNSVSLSVIPNPSNTGQGLSFNISGDASTWVEDYMNGVNAPNSSVVTGITSDAGARAWGFSGTAAQAGSHTWQRKWKHWGGSSWSDWCSVQTGFSINQVAPVGPATCDAPPKWNTYGIDTYYDYGSYQQNDPVKVANWYCINKCGGTGSSGPTTATVFGPGSTWVPTGLTRTNNQGWDQIQDLKCTFPANGTLNVNTTPVSGGVTVDGTSWGNAPQSRSLAPGTHTVSFGAVSGYITPANQSVTVSSNVTTTSTGTYTLPANGTLSVTTTPVSGGITVNGSYWGNSPQSRSLAPGTYTVSFGAVSGYSTPANQTMTVSSNVTTSSTGTYVMLSNFGSTTINTSPVNANGSSQYVLAVQATTNLGTGAITNMNMDINSYSGSASRGSVFWSSTLYNFNGVTRVTCSGSGGGYMYVNPPSSVPGNAYTNFLSCTNTLVSATRRDFGMTVTFNPVYTTPVTGNILLGAFIVSGSANYTSNNATFNLIPPPNPTVTSITASPASLYQNQVTRVTMTITDPQGGADVGSAYVMINRDGASAGQYRGYFGWSSQGFPSWGGSYASIASCANGANPAGQVALYNGYGNTNITLGGCFRSVSGNTVTLDFDVTPLYTLPSANTFSGYALDTSGNLFNWAPFGTFTMYPPATGSTSINSSPVNNNALTQYVISLGINDPKGAANVTSISGYINEYNPNPSTSRGYLKWDTANTNYGFTNLPCTGGGYFYPWPSSAYDGNKYLNFISCRITDVGTTRTLAVTVTFNPIFLTPLTGNRIVNSIGSQALFDVTVVNPTATFSGKITDGSSCLASAPAIAFNAANNIYETQVPGNTASINAAGNYSLANVTLKTSPAVNLFCANLTPPSGGSYKLACATSSTGTASVSGNCAQVNGATGSAVTLNMGFRLITQVRWYQTLLSDVYSNYGSGANGIYKRLPSDASPYSSSPFLADISSASSDNYATGIAISKGTVNVQDDGGTDKTANNSLKNSSSSYKNYKLSAYDSKFGFGRTINFGSAPSGATNVSACGSFFDGSSRSAGVYKMTSSCFSTAMGASDKTYNFGGGTSVLYVTGGGITLGYKLQGSNNSRLVLVVDGDITVSKNVGSAAITQATVGDIQATLIAKGKIKFETNGTLTDTSVVVDGAVITTTDTGRISFERDRGANNITYPGVLIRFKPKDLVDLNSLELGASTSNITGLFINDVRWSSD